MGWRFHFQPAPSNIDPEVVALDEATKQTDTTGKH
jgi:hypothetical protein